MSISMLVGWALGEQACSVGPRNKCPVHTNLSEAVHAWKVVPAYDDLLGRRLPKYSSGQPGHRCGTQMSGISSLDVSNLREPILIALVIVLIGYLVAQRFQQTGCPFAPSSAKSTSTAAKQQMASTTGSLRLTLAQLADYDGRDASKPLCISVRGKIYDVTAGRTFYGPGGPYAVFAGKECARALAFMKVAAEDCNGNLEGATAAQIKTLEDWESKFRQKYGIAGEVVSA